ncbi:MAG TPA: response regulator [Candidatus Omnitrophota bacterium]|nr:response regulator [Candidatus Omnitrophota bacterium]HPS20630.1 response regulator [Candidatus Omnitrophota bacterium]
MSVHKILIVDDEEGVRNAIKRVLRPMDYDVIDAGSAEDALMIIKKTNGIDMVISDYCLQNMNGVDFLSEVNKNDPTVITILITGHADLKVALDAINRACLYKFILKPWDNEDLMVTVKRALEQRDLIRENKRLLTEIRKKDLILQDLEKNNPGITKVKRDDSGSIIIS